MGAFDEINDPQHGALIAVIASRIDHDDLVEPGFWAFVWLADMNQLEIFTRDFARGEHPRPRYKLFNSIRYARSFKRCRDRDDNHCLVSLARDCIEVAHIYPFPLSMMVGNKEYRDFWEILSTFCTPTVVKEWRNAVSGEVGVKVLSNLMCLDPMSHGLWGKAKFALKPVEITEDGKTLKVEFYWLSDSTYTFRSLETLPATPRDLDSTQRRTPILNCEGGRHVRSGEVLTFKTDDPQRWPLPSMQLLRIQWLLNRLVSLTGAADLTDKELDKKHIDSEED